MGRRVNLYETVAASPTLYLFIVLRHRTLSFTIYLSKEAKQALRLITRIPLIQRRERRPSREKKAHSHSGFLLSMYVVLKTRYVSPNIHIRRY